VVSPVVLDWMNAILMRGSVLTPLFSDRGIQFPIVYPLNVNNLREKEGKYYLPCACIFHTICSNDRALEVSTEGTILSEWCDGGGFYRAIPQGNGNFDVDPLPRCYTPPGFWI
jgi:hypothetical protein